MSERHNFEDWVTGRSWFCSCSTSPCWPGCPGWCSGRAGARTAAGTRSRGPPRLPTPGPCTRPWWWPGSRSSWPGSSPPPGQCRGSGGTAGSQPGETRPDKWQINNFFWQIPVHLQHVWEPREYQFFQKGTCQGRWPQSNEAVVSCCNTSSFLDLQTIRFQKAPRRVVSLWYLTPPINIDCSANIHCCDRKSSTLTNLGLTNIFSFESSSFLGSSFGTSAFGCSLFIASTTFLISAATGTLSSNMVPTIASSLGL